MNDDEDISAEEMRSLAAEIASLYPPPRAGTEIVLLEVNPHRAHAYWNIDLEENRRIEDQSGQLPLVIRLHDVTGIEFDGRNPHDTNDTIVSGLQGQTDLNVWKDGRTYLAELGYRKHDGHLITLAASDRVDVPCEPRPGPADSPPPHVPSVSPASEAGVEMAGVLHANGAALALADTDSQDGEEVAVTAGPWPDEDELSALLPPRVEKVEAWYERLQTENSPITVAQQAMNVQVEAASPEIRIGPAHEGGAVEAGIADDASRPTPSSGSFSDAPIRLEEYLTYSSHGLGRPVEDVEVHIDIVLHGRVPPGRTATLFGRPVQVDADGRFQSRQELSNPGPMLPYLLSTPAPEG